MSQTNSEPVYGETGYGQVSVMLVGLVILDGLSGKTEPQSGSEGNTSEGL